MVGLSCAGRIDKDSRLLTVSTSKPAALLKFVAVVFEFFAVTARR